MVVVFHAAPNLLGGGFVGVDVFFVISGFLITGLLYRELRRSGHISLPGFYVRRVRRILPAAALALAATFLLSAAVVSPLALPRVSGDGVAAALSVSNIRFALASGDYFAAVTAPSPFLQFWSLSVEEQFYLFWPALLLIVFRLGRGTRGVALTVAMVALGSLLLALVLTDVAASWAFYSLPTRAWELALGGLLAIAALRPSGSPSHARLLAIVGWIGLGAVLLAGIAFDDTLAYPGYWALLPTIGAAAMIAGGHHRGGAEILLGSRPMRFFGRISYSLYLWHWPLLILPLIAYGDALSVGARVGLVTLAILVATLSTLFVEEPIRRGSRPGGARKNLALAGGPLLGLALAVLLGVSATGWATDTAIAESRRGETASRGETDPLGETAPDAGTGRGAEGAPASTPRAGPKARATARPGIAAEPTRIPKPTRTPKPRRSPEPTSHPVVSPTPKPRRTPKPTPTLRLPADVRPSVWDAADDVEALVPNGCLHKEDPDQSAQLHRRSLRSQGGHRIGGRLTCIPLVSGASQGRPGPRLAPGDVRQGLLPVHRHPCAQP